MSERDTARAGRWRLRLWIGMLLLPGAGAPAAERLAITPAPGELAAAVAAARHQPGLVIELAPGDYHVMPRPYRDATCGNCEDPATPVPATLGLRITGREIVLRGADPGAVRIHTHAGYGLLFEECRDCRLEGVTVTGGERDTCGRATDAAILARRATLTLRDCVIAGNLGDSATVARTVVGIIGVCGREGADLTIENCRILRNSWDGVALYRDARATLRDCVIDGIDRGRGGPACGGRGVGIGITWNARARIEGCLVRRYWKGIGVFVDAEAEVWENIVEDVLTWGITLWDAGRGHPYAQILENAVYRTGACGIAITRGEIGGRPGSRVIGNALVETGRNPRYDSPDTYCRQCALAREATTPEIVIAENLYLENREPGNRPGGRDLSGELFRARLTPLLARLHARPALAASAFLARFPVAPE